MCVVGGTRCGIPKRKGDRPECHEVIEFDWLLLTQALGRQEFPATGLYDRRGRPFQIAGKLEFVDFGNYHCLTIEAISNTQVLTGKRAAHTLAGDYPFG
jgi:hypothetical protein